MLGNEFIHSSTTQRLTFDDASGSNEGFVTSRSGTTPFQVPGAGTTGTFPNRSTIRAWWPAITSTRPIFRGVSLETHVA
jgi:hypothetical protein